MVSIYVLIDPRTKEVRYVGQTNNLIARYKNHCSRSVVVALSLKAWIEELRSSGLKPEILELEKVLPEQANETERFYIGYLRMLGATLLNSKFDRGVPRAR